MRNLTSEELEKRFPKLRAGNYQIASRAAPRYNCMAFVNDDERHWWQQGLNGGRFYWPEFVRHRDTLESWTEIFTRQGYQKTDKREIEAGVEKIAIYVDLRDMLPSHVVKSDGTIWKSKLGKGQDIHHTSLDVLEGDVGHEYGVVGVILGRKVNEE